MENKNFYTPAEIVDICCGAGKGKTQNAPWRLFLLGILAGAFIGLAAVGSNMAAHNLLANPSFYGLGRLIAGGVFSIGLMLVVIAGGELFTGNTLIVVAVLEKKAKVRQMLLNWVLVFAGNFVGGLLIAALVSATDTFSASAGVLGGLTIKIAVGKANLPFSDAFFLGILCNWLVCLGVWLAFAAKDITGKIFACFFPILLFVTGGYEHCVANMCYMPMGLFAKNNPAWVESALSLGVTPEALDSLTWGSFFIDNLIPVTLGNIVGGAVCVGMVYWFAYKYRKK